MSRDLGQDVADFEKLYARKLWADFSYPIFRIPGFIPCEEFHFVQRFSALFHRFLKGVGGEKNPFVLVVFLALTSGVIRSNRKFEWLGRIGLTRYKNRGLNCELFAWIDSRESRCESPVPLSCVLYGNRQSQFRMNSRATSWKLVSKRPDLLRSWFIRFVAIHGHIVQYLLGEVCTSLNGAMPPLGT